jgi:hypothetical protein
MLVARPNFSRIVATCSSFCARVSTASSSFSQFVRNASADPGSIRRPGPIVVESAIDFMYVPLVAAGLAFSIASIRAPKLSHSWLVSNERDAVLDLAGLLLGNGAADIRRDGAELRVGHQTARAEHPTELADHSHHVGGRDHAVELHPALVLDLLRELLAADVISTGIAGLLRLVALREHQDARFAPCAVRQHDRAAHHLVGVARIDAKPHRDIDALVELGGGQAREQIEGLFDRIELALHDLARGLVEAFAVTRHRLLRDLDAHRTRRPRDDLDRLVDVVGVEVCLLDLRDLLELVDRDRAHLVAIRLPRALRDLGGAFEQHGRGRRLELEREAAVLVDRDVRRNDQVPLILRARIERLAELHDVHAVLTERGADGRRRIRLPGRALQLDDGLDLLRHDASRSSYAFSTFV